MIPELFQVIAQGQQLLALLGCELRCRSIVGLRRRRNGVGKRDGYIFAGRVPSFCDKVFRNGQDTRLRSRFGYRYYQQ